MELDNIVDEILDLAFTAGTWAGLEKTDVAPAVIESQRFDAKQALTELIEREKKKAHHNGYTAGHYKGRNSMDEVIIEARINELENIPVGWPKIIISDSEAYHLLKQVIQDRLAELKPSKETAE